MVCGCIDADLGRNTVLTVFAYNVFKCKIFAVGQNDLHCAGNIIDVNALNANTFRALGTGSAGCALGALVTLITFRASCTGCTLGALVTLIALRSSCTGCTLGTLVTLFTLRTGGAGCTLGALVTLITLRTGSTGCALGALITLITLRAGGAGCTLGALVALITLRTGCTHDLTHVYTGVVRESQHQFACIAYINVCNADTINAIFSVFTVSAVLARCTNRLTGINCSFVRKRDHKLAFFIKRRTFNTLRITFSQFSQGLRPFCLCTFVAVFRGNFKGRFPM